MIQSSYLEILFNPKRLSRAVARAKRKLQNIRFGAIAVTGNSGTIFGGALAQAMSKPLILVRKPDVSSHSGYSVEGDDEIKTYLFVDDFISSGYTFQKVRDSLADNNFKAKCVGVYEYCHDRLRRYKQDHGWVK